MLAMPVLSLFVVGAVVGVIAGKLRKRWMKNSLPLR